MSQVEKLGKTLDFFSFFFSHRVSIPASNTGQPKQVHSFSVHILADRFLCFMPALCVCSITSILITSYHARRGGLGVDEEACLQFVNPLRTAKRIVAPISLCVPKTAGVVSNVLNSSLIYFEGSELLFFKGA